MDPFSVAAIAALSAAVARGAPRELVHRVNGHYRGHPFTLEIPQSLVDALRAPVVLPAAPSPQGDDALTLEERIELERTLSAPGLGPGTADDPRRPRPVSTGAGAARPEP